VYPEVPSTNVGVLNSTPTELHAWARYGSISRVRARPILLFLLALAAGCAKRSAPVPPDKSVFGEIAPRDDVDFTPYLAMARAIITHAERPATLPPPMPGQRTFVTLWAPGRAPVIGTGLGPSLMASVVQASEAIVANAPPNARVQIDVVASAETDALVPDMREPLTELGTRGYIAIDGQKFGYVLPSELLAFKYFDTAVENGTVRLAHDRIAPMVATRAGAETPALETMRVYRFNTTSRVESSPPGRAIPLFRSFPPRPAQMGPAELVAAVRAGGEYLARVINEQGRYQYMVHPVQEEADRSYGMLRHAGSTYALLEAYGETQAPELLAKAEAAIAYMKTRLQTTPDGSFLSDNADEEQQKVGGGGLALIALAKHAEVTRKMDDLETMRSLARFIAHQQYPDGHYRANADVMLEDEAMRGKKLKKEVSYFPGEATLGLTRLYALDPQPQWLETAKKAADYLIFQRDAHDDEDHQIHDHWLSYAILDLYRATKTQAYADHAFKIARAILKSQHSPAKARSPDIAGAFFDQGESAPAATRLEAIAADLELSRFMGKDQGWLDGPAMQIACHLRGQQYDEQNSFFLKHPERMLGGVRESVTNTDIRIDYVQHAMSAWLHLARVLRDPEYGKANSTLPADAGAMTKK
jgi:hypothetical protein